MSGIVLSLAMVADRHVGRRLRERRVQRGLSLAELAGALGVSIQQARKYEAGVNGIPAARLPQLAAILGVTTGWFFEELAEATSPYRPVLPTRPRMLLDLVRVTDELSEGRLQALCEAARALAAVRAAAYPAAGMRAGAFVDLRPSPAGERPNNRRGQC
jgi:transcriptional regulator with XRE-family HTH domain